MIKEISHKNARLIFFLIIFIIFLNSAPLLAGTATLSWDAPTTNADGTAPTDLAGYKVYYGTSSGNYTSTINAGNVTTYQITNLTNGLIYYFAVTTYNTSENESGYSNEVSKTIQDADTTPPQITGIYSNNITTGSATINWTTNEASDTQVGYGLTLSFGYTTNLNTQLVTAHSQILNNLNPSTLYYYRVLSRDSSGNLATSTANTFNTSAPADTTPPVISNVQITNITTSSVTIIWTTNEASTSQVEYGLTTSYGNLTSLNSNLVTTHTVNITGLSGYTRYNLRVRSRDAATNEAISANYSFTTSNTSPTVVAFSANPTSGVTPLAVNFTASASDPDGYIVIYEWDFDGDGNYDLNTGSVTASYFTYANAGNYNARVRVTDNGGASAVSNALTITATAPANQPPAVSSITATSATGTSSLALTFTVAASDPDGSIVQYEWDFDGNGTYDATTATNPVSYTYTNTGTYTARVRVTDNQGATAMGETNITVTRPSSESPSTNTSSQSGGGGCFIATAAYGSYLDPHVMVLREFRDKYLLTNTIGRIFVKLYYKTSPPIAEFISKHEMLRTIIRILLTPAVLGIKNIYNLLIIFVISGMFIKVLSNLTTMTTALKKAKIKPEEVQLSLGEI